MTHELPSRKPNQADSSDKSALRNEIVSQIPVELFIERFQVIAPGVKEVLHAYPTLCYLLGIVTTEPQTSDTRPDGVERPVYFLTEGSGMFDLKNKEDAMRWRGIFNHIMGTARQVYFLADRLSQLTSTQKQQLEGIGFDINSLSDVDPLLLRDFMFISHAGRRQMDEYNWHGLRDNTHPSGNSYTNTIHLLQAYNASSDLIKLMRTENHEYEVGAGNEHGLLPDVSDNILTYCDWTFGQKPNTLQERFDELRKNKRLPIEMLYTLESYGQEFENALKQVAGRDIFDSMIHAGHYLWETQIRKAYAVSSGLTLEELFPLYKK